MCSGKIVQKGSVPFCTFLLHLQKGLTIFNFTPLPMNRIKFDLLRYKASLGNAVALFELYEIYKYGDEELGIPEDADHDKAIECLLKSADKGYAPAIGELGYLYLQSEVDPDKGLKMEIEAADKGYARSMYRVGEYFFTGKTFSRKQPEGLEVNLPRAIEYWEKAIEQNDSEACLAYAKAMIMGVGLEENYTYAIDYLDAVCGEITENDVEEPFPIVDEALFWKGYLYYYGMGVDADRDMADKLFQLSYKAGFWPATSVIDDGEEPREALMDYSYPYDYDTWCEVYKIEKEYDCPFQEPEDKYDNFSKKEVKVGKLAMLGDSCSLVKVARMVAFKDPSYCRLLFVKTNRTESDDQQYREGGALYLERHYLEAIEKLLSPAYEGYISAMYYLAKSYEAYSIYGDEGCVDDDIEVDYCKVQAFMWYLMAACNGDKKSQFYIGKAFFDGDIPYSDSITGVKDYSAAARWFEYAAHDTDDEKGIPDAATYLEKIYSNGLINGIPDPDKASEWYGISLKLSANKEK